jgi:hypothetical protein
LRCLEAPLAHADDLTRMHHSAYFEQIFEHAPLEGYRQLDPDTAMNPHSRGAPHGSCGHSGGRRGDGRASPERVLPLRPPCDPDSIDGTPKLCLAYPPRLAAGVTRGG